jgi:hypothetical protein
VVGIGIDVVFGVEIKAGEDVLQLVLLLLWLLLLLVLVVLVIVLLFFGGALKCALRMGDINCADGIWLDLVWVVMDFATMPSINVWLLVILHEGKQLLMSCEKDWAAITFRREFRQQCLT